MELPRCKLCGEEIRKLDSGGGHHRLHGFCPLSETYFSIQQWLTLMSPDPMTERMAKLLRTNLGGFGSVIAHRDWHDEVAKLLTEYNSKEGK